LRPSALEELELSHGGGRALVARPARVGAGHGFLDPEEHGEAFDADAAQSAEMRMLEFLADGG